MSGDLGSHRFSSDKLARLLDACIGSTFAELDASGVLDDASGNKGRAGAVIEQSVLGYPADSYQRPDLEVDGIEVELKVTGLVQTRGSRRATRGAGGRTINGDPGYRAKEPMSITAVSPDSIVKEEFETSAFWHKAEHLLIVYYLYVIPGRGVKFARYGDFEVKGWELHEWSEEDRARLERDWSLVQSYVRLAVRFDARDELLPNLSSVVNRLLLYLDTAPKWPNPPRFRLKNSLVTHMARAHFGERLEQLPHVIETMDDVDARLREVTRLHGGRTLGELAAEFGVKAGQKPSKQLIEQVACRMLGGQSRKMSQIDLFAKASLLFKGFVQNARGGKTEDMKLLAIDFDELLASQASFEDSAFYAAFSQSQLMCCVLEEPDGAGSYADNRFLGFKRVWLGDLLGEVELVWREMRRLVAAGELRDTPVLLKDGRPRLGPKTGLPSSAPNWPKSSAGDVFVRGAGGDARDKNVEVAGVRMYRQYLWLHGSWVCGRLAQTGWV